MRPIPGNLVIGDSKNPVTLVGVPGDRSMSGYARIQNRNDKRLVTNSCTIRFSPFGHTGKGDAGEVECTATILAMIPARQSMEVPIRASIPSNTRPGKYPGVLVLGTNTCPLILLVADNNDTRIAPSKIFVTGATGGVIKQIYVSNFGNVMVDVGPFGAIPLDYEIGKPLEAIGMIRVDTKDGRPVIVEPGETARVDLVIHVPELPAVASRYSALLKVVDADCQIVVVPPGEAAGDASDSTMVRSGVGKVRRPK
jgi:hypothetical protein